VKEAFIANGFDPISHYELHGKEEGIEPQPVAPAPSTLTEALAKLADAQKAEADFLKTVAIDNTKAGGSVKVEAGKAIDTDVTTDDSEPMTAVNHELGTVGSISADRSDTFNEAVSAENVAILEKAVNDELKEVNKVAGLKAAVDAVAPAREAVEAAV